MFRLWLQRFSDVHIDVDDTPPVEPPTEGNEPNELQTWVLSQLDARIKELEDSNRAVIDEIRRQSEERWQEVVNQMEQIARLDEHEAMIQAVVAFIGEEVTTDEAPPEGETEETVVEAEPSVDSDGTGETGEETAEDESASHKHPGILW